MSKNVMEPERQQMIWRRVACWISKAARARTHASARAHTHEVLLLYLGNKSLTCAPLIVI